MSTQTLKHESMTQDCTPHADIGHFQHIGLKNLGMRLAGTYILREVGKDKRKGFLRLVTLMEDGTWVSSHSHQHSTEFGFTNQQGVWEATGSHGILAKVIDFDYNPDGGCPTGVSKIGFSMVWSEDYREVRGEMYGERYSLDQDPLDPDAIPNDNFGYSFTGQRIMTGTCVQV